METNVEVPLSSSLPPASSRPFLRTWTGWLVIILVLAILGINVFLYLAKGTQVLANLSKSALTLTTNLSKAIVSESASGVQQTATTLDKVAASLPASPPASPPIATPLAHSTAPLASIPEPMDSEMLSGAPATGPGYCFIGEERGYRTCAEVGVNDKCMSGDIFPSAAICMNPSLRS